MTKYKSIEIVQMITSKICEDNLGPWWSGWSKDKLGSRVYPTWCAKSQIFLSLNHWGWVTHICISKLTIIGSDNGLSPGRRQAIIWTNDWILLIQTFRTHFSEIVSKIHTFSFRKMHFKMSSGKWRPSYLRLKVLMALDTAHLCSKSCHYGI